MIYATLKLLHVLAIVVWIGGMVFAHFFLRPAAMQLEAPVRVRLMHATLQRFFAAVLVAIGVVLASGLWMIGRVAKESVQAGLGFAMPLNWTIMATLGIIMMLIFGHIRFALFKRLRDDGHTVILITHDPEVAAHADRILVMRDGELHEEPRKGNGGREATGSAPP